MRNIKNNKNLPPQQGVETLSLRNIVYPEHKEQLELAENTIKKIELALRKANIGNTFKKHDGGDTHSTLYDDTIRVLLYIADLSLPVFNLMDSIESKYYSRYPNDFKLARKLFLAEYESLHMPYDTLKNKCYSLLNDIDRIYYIQTKKQPPNKKDCYRSCVD